MSPGRPVRIPLYWILVGILCVVGSPVLSIYASVKIAQSNARELASEFQQRRCLFYNRTLDVYDQEPPTTETGRALREAYLLEYRYLGCAPERS